MAKKTSTTKTAPATKGANKSNFAKMIAAKAAKSGTKTSAAASKKAPAKKATKSTGK